MPAGDGQLSLSWRKVPGGFPLKRVGLRSLLEGAPFPSHQNFHFSVDKFHGHGPLIETPHLSLFLGKRKGQRHHGDHEHPHGHNQFRGQRPPFLWRCSYHVKPPLMIEIKTPNTLTTMIPTSTPFSATRAVVTTCAVACSC